MLPWGMQLRCRVAVPALVLEPGQLMEECFILGSSWLTQETLFIIFLPPGALLQRIMA